MKSFFSLKTLRWSKGKLYMIDQRLLPKKLVYIKVSTYNEVAEAIKKMVVRGAPAIGVAAAMGLALTAYKNRGKKREIVLKELVKAKKKIESARPTAINLFWALNRVMKKAEESGEEIVKAVIEEANKIAQEDFEANRKLGKIGSSLINNGDSILTHCKQLF
jgi:methylthioribose-1-phosphate isomerase